MEFTPLVTTAAALGEADSERKRLLLTNRRFAGDRDENVYYKRE